MPWSGQFCYPQPGVPVHVVWADNVHAGGQNAIDIYIEGIRIIPKDGHPPFAIDSNPNDVAQAIVFSFDYWKSLQPLPTVRKTEAVPRAAAYAK